MPINIKELLAHRTVQIALAIVAVILAGSVTYYLIESNPPTLSYVAASEGPIAQTITGSGTVSPIENPDLSFAQGGRVTYVHAQVGDKVAQGTVLATLDTGVLSAELSGAQAKLDELVAGPRAVDTAGQQTALTQAKLALPNTLRTAEAQAENAVTATDALYTDAQGDPVLAGLLISDADSKAKSEQLRRGINSEIDEWRTEVASGSVTTDVTIAHLRNVQAYLDELSIVVNNTRTTTSAEAATLTTYTTAVNTSRSAVSGLILSVTQADTAVKSAEDQVNLVSAGTPSEEIDAQRAQVAGIAAQLRQQEIIAPFSGTIASVSVKEGDVVAANTTALSLVPEGSFEVAVYVSEVEATKLHEGDAAEITLDAYGASRVFPATISVIDTAPSSPDATTAPGYKVTLVFTQNDPAIAVGMHANATIHGGSKDQALIVPKSALIEDGAETYVLKQTTSGPVKTVVTVGLISQDSAEILSGITAGDGVARVGSR